MPKGLAFADLGPEPPDEESGDEAALLAKAMPKASDEERQAMLDAIKACVRRAEKGEY